MQSKKQKIIAKVFNLHGHSEEQQLQKNQFKKVLQIMATKTKVKSTLDQDMINTLWTITKNDGTTATLKSYIKSLSNVLNNLEKSISQTIKKQKNQNSVIYSKKQFLNFKIFYQIFLSYQAVQKIQEEKFGLSYQDNEQDIIREQNINAQTLNYIMGDPESEAIKLLQKGIQYASKKNHHQAISYWEQACKLEPKNYVHYSNICRSLVELNEFQNAITYGLKAVQHQPKDPYAHMNLALAYAGQGNESFKKALQHSKIGFQLNKDDSLCCIDRAKILEITSDKEGALNLYQKAKELSASQKRIQFNEDYVKESLDEKFNKLKQCINHANGSDKEKEQAIENAELIRSHMVSFINLSSDVDQKAGQQGADALNKLKNKFVEVQQQIPLLTQKYQELDGKEQALMLNVKDHDDQIIKLNAWGRELRQKMRKCLAQLSTIKTIQTFIQKLQKRVELLEQKLSSLQTKIQTTN